VDFAFNSNATGLAAPDSRIFQSPRREHAPAFGLDRACAQRSADRAFVEMIGLGSISQPTGLKSERALTVDHIELGSIIWRTFWGPCDAKNLQSGYARRSVRGGLPEGRTVPN
jgi:hypothetical protein